MCLYLPLTEHACCSSKAVFVHWVVLNSFLKQSMHQFMHRAVPHHSSVLRALVTWCVIFGVVLTSRLPRSVHCDLYGSVISSHLRWVREYCDCQHEALSCKHKKVQTRLIRRTMCSIHRTRHLHFCCWWRWDCNCEGLGRLKRPGRYGQEWISLESDPCWPLNLSVVGHDKSEMYKKDFI